MLDIANSDLTFPKMQYGTHQVPWNMAVLLYKGAAGVPRDRVEAMIRNGYFGSADSSRQPLVGLFHEQISAQLARGGSPATISSTLGLLWDFFRWADSVSADLSPSAIKFTFKIWTERLLHRVHSVKDLTHTTAYSDAMVIANLIARAINIGGHSPGAGLVRLTRLRNSPTKKSVLGTQADKTNLEATLEFGNFLADICDELSVAVLRGPLPVRIALRDERSVVIASGLKKTDLVPYASLGTAHRKRYLDARAPLDREVSVLDDIRRTRLLTLRVEAELLIFIAQSGMNLAQACRLKRESYRWQTDGEDLTAFRVFKGRRGGEAVFRCFKAYRKHWQRYLKWIEDTGWSQASDKLFPFLYPAKVPPEHALPHFSAIRSVVQPLGLSHFGPKSLRKTRVNWLLRRSGDAELTAEMAAHAKQTLLHYYQQPHHQRAAVEITKFHLVTDPSIESPGPGLCAANNRTPTPVAEIPSEAASPDCISPEGCLFCKHHRDVLSRDYCWKLASHARLKVLEISLYKPSSENPIHPGNRVIDRINDKLEAIAEGSDAQAEWVREVQDLIRSGRYHPTWDGHIQLLEVYA